MLRLTNLTQLTVDTSWWTRYRIDDHNPDLDPNFVFPQAVPTGHTAIPRTDADTSDPNFLEAIANTAGFHFATIEQGGTSLYPATAQRATHPEVLQILISIGPTETMYFQTWQDKAGNATPLTAKDPVTGVSVTFPDLTMAGENLKANLIMPEPCPFLSRKLPRFWGGLAGLFVAVVGGLVFAAFLFEPGVSQCAMPPPGSYFCLRSLRWLWCAFPGDLIPGPNEPLLELQTAANCVG